MAYFTRERNPQLDCCRCHCETLTSFDQGLLSQHEAEGLAQKVAACATCDAMTERAVDEVVPLLMAFVQFGHEPQLAKAVERLLQLPSTANEQEFLGEVD